MTTTSAPEIEQVDREAAADMIRALYAKWGETTFKVSEEASGQSIRAGERDDGTIVRAFARHRIEALNRTDATASTGLVELRPEDCATSDEAQRDLAIRSPLNRAIYKALRDYRLSNMADEDGHPYPLVDCLSNPAPADIGTGEMEMVALADEIEAATALSSQATALAEAEARPVAGITPELLGAAMQDAWGEICDDTGCHPLDIRRDGRKLFYDRGHWTDLIALRLIEGLTTPGDPRDAGERP